MRNKLSTQGKDVSTLDAKIAQYNATLQQARVEWNAAVALYLNATPSNVDDIAKQAHEHVKKAQEYLKEVRDDLREIVAEIRNQNAGTLPSVPGNASNASA